MADKTHTGGEAFQIPWGAHVLSGIIHNYPWLWTRLGNLETKVFSETLETITIDKPIYVAGLARSGSTILLEILASHRGVASHCYKDFPAIFTPLWWSRWLEKSSAHRQEAPTERAHGDGLMVTTDSPEAMEECVWQAFFRDAHNPALSSVLDGSHDHPRFEKFYRNHLRKILKVRGGERYLSKGNYNLTRLQYLLKIFPDARIVIPIRHPVNHIASLMKQHNIFIEGETNSPRALTHMQRIGHYEFGLDRRVINTGNTETVREIEQLWSRGETVRGWARYWAALYQWVMNVLEEDETLSDATMVVRYEDLCNDPETEIRDVLQHCELKDVQPVLDRFVPKIHAPDYYQPSFSLEDQAVIIEETAPICDRYGYDLEPVGIAGSK